MKILFLLLVLFSQSSFATIYKCGTSAYQDTPCSDPQTQQILSSSNSLTGVAAAADFTDIKSALYTTIGILAGVSLLLFGGALVLSKLGLSKKQFNKSSSRVSYANKRQKSSFSPDDYYSSVDDNYYSSQKPDDYY